MNWKSAPVLAILFLPFASAQVTISEIKLRTEPADARIRPFETAVIQVLVYGEVVGKDGEKTTGRLRRAGAQCKVVDSGGGWLSKPFKFQGNDDEQFVEEYQTTAGRIFGSLSTQYVLQDSVLYTAPEKPGKYKVEATLEGKTAAVTIDVDPDAPSSRKPEKTSFPPEPFSLDPYRQLAEHYAPFLAQETWFQPKADFPSRFDYDGDWEGNNNWNSLDTGSSQAYVHYAAMETATHWFLIYNVFHPRDYSDKCVIGTCHENDNEGLILTVAKDGSEFGRLQVMETLAHNNIYSFTADDRIRNGVHDIDGRIELYQGSHPAVFVESGGHGIYGTQSTHSRYSLEHDEFTAGTGVTFIYKGVAERPQCANSRLVGYDLLPIYQQWWTKAHSGSGWTERSFDDFFEYRPFGGRPGVPYRTIAGAFLGRKEAENKARPFWGWFDNRTKKDKILAQGQWGLDPAYAVSRDLRFPSNEPFSLDYVFNPYLGVESGAPAPSEISQAPAPAAPEAQTASHGWLEFRVWVDGSVEAYVQGEHVRYQVLSGGPIRDPEIGFSEPLPAAALKSLRVQKKEGRGSVRLLEQPSAENGFTAKLRIDDPRGGPGQYHVALEWDL
jgi:hypothetical protein